MTETADRLSARLVDWGTSTFSPVDMSEFLGTPSAVEALRDRGRGLAIIRMTTDHFAYTCTPTGENTWIVEKLLAISYQLSVFG